ncbi:AAA domain-containing protein [Legionella qingyii]|uniref:AAA domain-containing protein n=1 Tax=Legionella qingyii TaxID=2184757 RepID=UPI000F8D9DBA|nr:AAA domain-containing protein [Legionella qingyii]RUR24703.1 DUF4011 domain-containing protein [Legionella qingyii]
MTIQVRMCQGCKEIRSEDEMLCGNCGWDLTQEPLIVSNQVNLVQKSVNESVIVRFCLNGHPLDDGDELCFVPNCGATAAAAEKINEENNTQSKEIFIDGWKVTNQFENYNEILEHCIVERHGHRAQLTLYFPEMGPDLSIYEVLYKLPKNYILEVLAYGIWDGRIYEITALNSNPNLLDLLSISVDIEVLRQVVKSIGKILHAISEHGLRHGDLRPENIIINHKDPISLILRGFQYSFVSNIEIDRPTQPKSILYTAPEVIAGGYSAASDWWSLGITILQLITNGQYFKDINEKAFRIHVVTRGISLPKGLDPQINLLLRGLLAQDPDKRWQWIQLKKWLAGEDVEVPSENSSEDKQNGPVIELNEQTYVCPKTFALAAAEPSNWDQSKDLLMRGVVVTWLEERNTDPRVIAGVRVASSLENISDDFRLSLSLMWMNYSLPLIYRGDIVTSSWLLQNAVQGYEIITGPLITHLRQMDREPHLWDLQERNEKARERARILDIELNEESFRILVLASSRQNLERQWINHRRLFPGSDHRGLNSLIDRQNITEVELAILLGAELHQYQSAEQILNDANEIASQVGLSSYSEEVARQWFNVSRRDLYREIEDRIANYSRCGIPRVDEWANDFRIQKRILLSRALALLSVPQELWKEPDRLQYVSSIIDFFEKRAAGLAQRGPLVRMLISKTGSRIDLAAIAGNKPTASHILEHLINRTDASIEFDRVAFEKNIELEKKLRHLVNHANTYRRDTGIDSLYLGFPFLVIQDSQPENLRKKPKIAPILLWPVKIKIETRNKASIFFDRDREEVRLNPIFTNLIGLEESNTWKEVAKELLGRSSIRIADVIDTFGALEEPRERNLCELPSSDYNVTSGTRQIICSAVLFHAEFMGQALGEDLRQMRKESPTGTSFETVLRVNKDPIISPPQNTLIPEKDRYFTMESDPSQENAVFGARQYPGILIEGPPGTGKSQTIVNIIGDCIGRNQSILIICQKAAALEVIAKRLNAEGLQDRFFYITHVNKDRTHVIQNIRSQIEGITQSQRMYRYENVEAERNELAEKIEYLESEIDKYHEAIHDLDEEIGTNYRCLLGQLIELEDSEPKLINIPALRAVLGNLTNKQLSLIEETCIPIVGIWLKSSYEGSPLEKLKIFSSDEALINEFYTLLITFVNKEYKRNELNPQSNLSFEIEDPTPHQEWIKHHDKLLRAVDWKKVLSWFNLFSKGECSNGHGIIKNIQGIQQQLATLELEKYDFMLASKLIDIPIATIEEWLCLMKKTSVFNRLIFINYDSLKIDLENIKKQLIILDPTKNDPVLSKELSNIPTTIIEEWLSLIGKTSKINSSCFKQYEIYQNELKDLKNRLDCFDLNNQNEKLSSKLINIPIQTLINWISLINKITGSKNYFRTLNPLQLIRKYRIKNIVSNLNETLIIEDIGYFKNIIELEVKQRPIRDSVQLLLKTIYTFSEITTPLFPKDLDKAIDSMLGDLTHVYQLQKIILGLGENPSFEKVKKLQNAAELEIILRPIRSKILSFLADIYQENKQPEVIYLNNLLDIIEYMSEDLFYPIKARQVLLDLDLDQSFEMVNLFKYAIELECNLRPIRLEVSKLLEILYQENEILEPQFLTELISVTNQVMTELLLTHKAIVSLQACPRQEENIESIVTAGLPAYVDLIARYEDSFTRHQARINSLELLDKLYPFFGEELFNLCQTNIRENRSNLSELQSIIESFSTLAFYQEFRLLVPNFSSEILKIFSILREKETSLSGYHKDDLGDVIRRIFHREAKLYLKDVIEQKYPILRISQRELSRKIRNLDESSAKMRELNKQFLSNINLENKNNSESWEDITRLKGPRARRLREIIERGIDIGLMRIRPVWLMNPDTASQLLPLRAGMFDVVIYDEASQIPIENALPTLYRAKRTVISGDEKQMPPSNFFIKRFDDEDDDYNSEDDFSDEIMSETERDALEDSWNRREIKDSFDLLTLGKAVLPKSMLQIHYRSKYRELISFSNAAFYSNELSIPVRHPESVIKNVRPIEVIRVDSIYANQTNKGEAEKVVDLLSQIWSSPENIPSIGVVTFNAKQADLIEDLLAERAEKDSNFHQSLSNERERQQGGEDMSFFVKNVENVQGDERDMIIFSSTFGRDEKGIFRKQFGRLGQSGGERRLNVAITRAREKIILVTSLPINEISDALSKRQEPKISRDYIQAYFDYASKISDGSLELANNSLNRMSTEVTNSNLSINSDKDGFVRSVETYITNLGLKPQTIRENDAFGLDFVIEDPRNRRFGIGIECDAHWHPILATARAREVWRPKVLRLGIPYVHRISSYAWYHYREEEMERLKQALEKALRIIFKKTKINVSAEG